MKTRRIGTMKSTPSQPPATAIAVVAQKSKRSQKPISTSAGTVKRMPAASDSPAEAAVCTWLASSRLPSRSTPRSKSIASTAAGIEAETVMPTLRPR